MSSVQKVAANRINGRKSLGPRTRAGKAHSSRNAFRHGLAGFNIKNPAVFDQIEPMANAICGGDSNPLLFEQALVIAETELILRCVRTERVAAIERLRDGTAIALAKGNNSLAVGKARSLEGRLAYAELVRFNPEFLIRLFGGIVPPKSKRKKPNEPPEPPWNPTPPVERDEHDALREAMPDLNRLLRYERRAWSRRKRATREFMAVKACTTASVGT
jgi:hypothetical protein